jgi:hypothetical protein
LATLRPPKKSLASSRYKTFLVTRSTCR